ncbi:hypothetical protein LBMAG42_14320 [Deltaproteobacteria bacterium]|nr:hypothetical protein LBMAG42_14320 [Deltaproteobacteria bacterium]
MLKLPLVLRLLLVGAVVSVAALPGVAYAQPAGVFEGTGLLEMIPATGVVGDGATQSDLYVLALDANGAPIAGLSLKPAVSAGTVGALTDAGGGLYRLAYTAPKVDAKAAVTLTLKGKIGKEAVQKTWNVNVAPARSHQLTAAANPPRMTLGQDRSATLSFNLAGGDRQALSGVDLVITASTGTIENVTNLGGGQFTALYTAPALNYPHVAMVTVADKRDPSRTFGSLAIPMWGKVDFPVTVAPNALVMIKLGDQQFGPIQSDAQGRARVPILVPPGAQVAELIAIGADKKSTSVPLDLKVPEAKRISLVPTAAALPGDSRVQVPIHAVVVMGDGKPDLAAQVVFTTTGGTITAAKHEGNGVYTSMFTPPTGASAAQATITAALADKPAIQTAAISVNLVSVRPSKVDLTAEPTLLPATAEGFKVYAKVSGPDGVGLGARTITFGAAGARLKGDVKDLRNGDYQAVFTTSGNGPVELTATVASPVTGNPMSRLLLVPSRTRLNNDGVSSSMITVVSVDEFGYPVPNVAVTLKLTSGDGLLPQQATTNSEGLAQVFYTAGRKPGLVGIEAAAGDLVAAGGLAQVPENLALPSVPVAGSRIDAGLVAEWDKALAEVHLDREGMSGGVAAPALTTSVGAARATRAALTSDPATISPGGTVKLLVNLTDEAGQGVAGQKLDFLTSAGTVGTVTDMGGGKYSAAFTVPANASGDIKVSVATQDGTASSFMRVPVGGAEAAWSGASPFTTQPTADPYATQPVVAPPPVAPPPPVVAAPVPPPPVVKPPPAVKPPVTTTTVTKVDTESPWLRVRAGAAVSLYSYDQLPLTQATVLFPNELALSSASYGGHVQGRLFLPMLRQVGLEADFRGTTYSLDPVPLCAALDNECKDAELVSDTVLATRVVGVGRYVFGSGSNSFGVGGHVGWGISDVQTFTVKGGQEIQLTQLNLNSLVLGIEGSADIGNLFFVASFNEHLAGGVAPFNTEASLEAGYAFLPNLYGSVSGEMSLRDIGIENRDGEKVGQISDQYYGATISIGVQL